MTMRLSAIIQLLEEDPIVGELDGSPDPAAQFIHIPNAPRRVGRPVPFLDANVGTALAACPRISASHLLPPVDLERAIGFVRE